MASFLTTFLMLRGTFDKLAGNFLVSDADPSFCAWTLERVRQNLASNPLQLFDGKIFYPAKWTLAFSDHLLGLQPFYVVIHLFTRNVVLCLNVLLVLSTILCFMAMYGYLFSRLKNVGASLFGASLFAFAIPRLSQFGHIQLLNLFYMPIAIMALERYISSKRRFWGVVFVVLAILQALSSYYLAYPFLIYSAIHAFTVCWPEVADRVGNLKRLSLCYTTIALVVACFSWPYLIVGKAYENRGSIGELIDGSADLIYSYFSVPVHNKTWWFALNGFEASKLPHEKWLFMGGTCYVLLLLAVMLIGFSRSRRDRYIRSWLLGAVALFILSLGPFLVVSGHPTPVPLPHLLLYEVMPGFSSLTTPARMGLVLLFPVACLVSYALSELFALFRKARFAEWLQAPFTAGVIALLLWESRTVFAPVPFPTGAQIPASYRWLRTQALDGAVLDWPVGASGYLPTQYMHFHLLSGMRTVVGYSGFTPPSYFRIAREWESPRVEGLRYLKALGISTIVYHKLQVPIEHQTAVRALHSEGNLSLIYSDKATDVFAINVTSATTSDLTLQPILPDYADTSNEPYFAVKLRVHPESAVWINPLGRDGVCGKVTYSAGTQLKWGDNPLARRKRISNGVVESLKFLPVAALDGDTSIFPYASAQELIAKNFTDLGMRWDFLDDFRSLRSLSFQVLDARKRRKQYAANYATDAVRVTASDNASELSNLFDRNLETRWSTSHNIAPGMFIELQVVRGQALNGMCFWLGPNYLDYPTMFTITTRTDSGSVRNVPYRFGIVSQPDRPTENRLEITLEEAVTGTVRLEIEQPPPDGKWVWSISELQPYLAETPDRSQ